jgi:hypothetical protein
LKAELLKGGKSIIAKSKETFSQRNLKGGRMEYIKKEEILMKN